MLLLREHLPWSCSCSSPCLRATGRWLLTQTASSTKAAENLSVPKPLLARVTNPKCVQAACKKRLA